MKASLSHWIALMAVGVAGCTTSSELGRFDDSGSGGGGDGGSSGTAGAAGSSGNAGSAGSVTLTPVNVRLALGGNSTCAIDSTGAAVCFGDNYVGQLGVGNELLELSATPLGVQGLASGARALFGGAVSHCAVLDSGHVSCWGDSVFGILEGRGPVHAIAYAPFEAPGLSSVVSMGLGTYFHCALNVEGGVKCYGLNSAGQLGNGTLGDEFLPVDVVGLEPSVALAASMSGYFACAVTASGSVKCWGSNAHGQLGNGSTTDALAAAAVSGIESGATAIATGREHACAVVAGGVKCWGSNAYGQLARAGGPSLEPVEVAGLPAIAGLAAGALHTCALSQTGGVFCWGSTDSGSSPDGPIEKVATGALEIACGGRHSCALLEGSVLECWGSNERGQLGPFGGGGAPL